jgi:hypothetical protein
MNSLWAKNTKNGVVCQVKLPAHREELHFVHPVRNNVSLIYRGLDFRIILAGFNARLGFLMGFIL